MNRLILVVLVMGLVSAKPLFAADARLNSASDCITKAIALLNAANDTTHRVPFGPYRKEAIDALQKAQSDVMQARQYADSKGN